VELVAAHLLELPEPQYPAQALKVVTVVLLAITTAAAAAAVVALQVKMALLPLKLIFILLRAQVVTEAYQLERLALLVTMLAAALLVLMVLVEKD
jgi:hypothetical protein